MHGVRIGRLAGIPIHLHWSTLVIVGLVTAGLASAALPTVAPDAGTGLLVVAGLVGAVGLLASIVAHELAHALMARRLGIPVTHIDLWVLGGIAHLSREARTAGQEAAVAVVGPLTSIVIGLLAGAGALVLDGLPGAVLGYLGFINLLLAGFNLLPGAPLDGGRLLRAGLWARSGDPQRAGVQAATAGRWLGAGVAAFGFVELINGRPGLTLIVIGWFMMQSALAEGLVHRVQLGLRGRSAGSLAEAPVVLPEWSTVAWAVEQPGIGRGGGIVAVRDGDGALVGYVTSPQLRAIPAPERAEVVLRELAVPLGTLPVVGADERADGLLDRLRQVSSAVAVRDGGRLVGFVTPAAVQRLLTTR